MAGICFEYPYYVFFREYEKSKKKSESIVFKKINYWVNYVCAFFLYQEYLLNYIIYIK